MYKIYLDTTERYEKKVILRGDGNETDREEGNIDIVSALKRILDRNNLELEDISKIEANPGPGSFTGIKIGITIANILNWTTGKKSQKELTNPEYGKAPNIQK